MNNETVTVLVHRCRMEINLEPFFDKSTLANIRKLFRYVLKEPWRNTETINLLGEWLTARVAYTKDDLYTEEKRAIERAYNKKQLMNVKHAKAKYDRYSKILAAFEGLKTKNGIL